MSSLKEEITPLNSFYVRSHFPAPEINPETWHLTVQCEPKDGEGLFRFSIDGLRRMRQASVTSTLECAGNSRRFFREAAEGEIMWGDGAVGTAEWSGVPLSDLLWEGCNLSRSGSMFKVIVFEGSDKKTAESDDSLREPQRNYRRYMSFEQALRERNLLVALKMNGKELTKDHGFPARLIVPGWYGMASVKWLSKIVLSSDGDFRTYFNDAKYVYRWKEKTEVEPVTVIRIKSVVTSPLNEQRVPLGEAVEITGKAWSGSGEIVRVEVKVSDDDSWREAELGKPLGENSWVTWKKDWTPLTKGSTLISSRATDSEGNIQPDKPARNEFLYGYNAVNSVGLNVV